MLPTGRSCEDPWLTAAALAAETTHLKFLVALRPGLMQPSVAARMTSTFDRLSGGRLLINVVAGGSKEELEGDGLFISHDERYEAAEEFLTIWKRLLKGENVQFQGKHLQTQNGRLLFPPAQTPHPPVFWRIIRSRHSSRCKTYRCLFNLGRAACTSKKKIAQVKKQAEKEGRTVRFGIRLHVIVRETEDEAWQAAEHLIRHLDQETIDEAQKTLQGMDSVGQNEWLNYIKGIKEA